MHSREDEFDARAIDVRFGERNFTVALADGRSLTVPVAWYPRLENATSEQRNHWRLIGHGEGIHWPEIDEDLSVEGLLKGRSAPGVRKRIV